jgi:hypothetical protein
VPTGPPGRQHLLHVLSSVVSDLHAVTGRDIMGYLIAGHRDPRMLAQLARGRARRKISEVEQALEGESSGWPEELAAIEHERESSLSEFESP